MFQLKWNRMREILIQPLNSWTGSALAWMVVGTQVCILTDLSTMLLLYIQILHLFCFLARRPSTSRDENRGHETEYHYGHQPSDASEIFAQEHVR